VVAQDVVNSAPIMENDEAKTTMVALGDTVHVPSWPVPLQPCFLYARKLAKNVVQVVLVHGLGNASNEDLADLCWKSRLVIIILGLRNYRNQRLASKLLLWLRGVTTVQLGNVQGVQALPSRSECPLIGRGYHPIFWTRCWPEASTDRTQGPIFERLAAVKENTVEGSARPL